MKIVTIDKSLSELNIALGCLFYKADVVKTNSELWNHIENTTIPQIQEQYTLENLTEQINIKTSRQAYKNLGKEPSRYRVSSEALIRRILQGKGLYKINSVVDTNNLISIETGYSCGSYDLANLQDDLTFRIGKTGESYKGIGKEEINIENLPVFSDSIGAFSSPTSDSERAMITLDSKDILTILISFDGITGLADHIEKARKYLEKFVGATEIDVMTV